MCQPTILSQPTGCGVTLRRVLSAKTPTRGHPVGREPHDDEKEHVLTGGPPVETASSAGESGPQRALSLRQRAEVQEVLALVHLTL